MSFKLFADITLAVRWMPVTLFSDQERKNLPRISHPIGAASQARRKSAKNIKKC
jgi:hypothetical protein